MTIETVLLSYLDQLYPTYAEVPDTKPDRYIVVERTGGRETNHIAEATFAIQSYGPSLLDTIEMNEAVKGKMDHFANLSEICNCRLNSDYNFTDTETKRYRYQAVYDIKYYRNGE